MIKVNPTYIDDLANAMKSSKAKEILLPMEKEFLKFDHYASIQTKLGTQYSLKKTLEDKRVLELIYLPNSDNKLDKMKIQLSPSQEGQWGFQIRIDNEEITKLNIIYNNGIILDHKVNFPKYDALYGTNPQSNYDRFMRFTIHKVQGYITNSPTKTSKQSNQ